LNNTQKIDTLSGLMKEQIQAMQKKVSDLLEKLQEIRGYL
jgi:hypothetical protein